MADIVDFNAARDKRDGPDEQFVTTDQHGRKMFAFCFEYQMESRVFTVSLFAYDFEDAEKRLVAMRETLSLAGQIYSEITS